MTSVHRPTSPHLRWGISESFRTYVDALDDGTTICDAGCTEEQRRFVFPHDPHPHRGSSFRFHGIARLTGYNGLLDVSIRTPSIDYVHDRWILFIDDRQEPERTDRTPLVYLDGLQLTEFPSGLTHGSCSRPQLTFEGTYIFGNVYRTGHALDELEFTVPIFTDHHHTLEK